METIVLTLLSLIQSLLPQIGVDSTVVTKIIAALIQIVPLILNLSQSVIQSVQNVISALKTSGALTTDQLSALDALSAEIDDNWNTSVTAYLASKKKLTTQANLTAAFLAPPAAPVPEPLLMYAEQQALLAQAPSE